MRAFAERTGFTDLLSTLPIGTITIDAALFETPI
jgi:hypothetical protein